MDLVDPILGPTGPPVWLGFLILLLFIIFVASPTVLSHYDYRVVSDVLVISNALFFPIKIRLRDVSSATSIALLDALTDPANFAALWIGTFTRKVVVIRLRKGLFRRIVLGPANADAVATEILEGCESIQRGLNR
jgi:hypothetical protein